MSSAARLALKTRAAKGVMLLGTIATCVAASAVRRELALEPGDWRGLALMAVASAPVFFLLHRLSLLLCSGWQS